MNPYEILDVPKDADADTIKKAYRKAASQHHPDKGGKPEDFMAVQRAYDALIDPRSRARYDETGCMPDEPTMFERAVIEMQKMTIHFVEQCPDVEMNDLVGMMRRDLNAQVLQIRKEKANAERLIEKLRKSATRLKISGTAPNVLQKAVEGRAATIELTLAVFDKKLEFVEKCLEVLADYSYEFIVPERTMTTNWWSVGAMGGPQA